MNLISNFIPIDKLNKNKILLLKIQLIILILSKNVIDYKKRKILKLALNILLQDSKKCDTCERIKRSRKGSEKTIDPRSSQACFAWRLLNPVVFQSPCRSLPVRPPLAQSVKVQAACHLAFLSIIPPDKTVDLQRSFLHFHDLSYLSRAAYEKHFRASLIALPGSRRESAIGSADNAGRFSCHFHFDPTLSFIFFIMKKGFYLNLFYSKVWSSEIKYQIVDRL